MQICAPFCIVALLLARLCILRTETIMKDGVMHSLYGDFDRVLTVRKVD